MARGYAKRVANAVGIMGGTKIASVTIEYIIPIPLLGKLAEAIILKINEQKVDLMMTNLQVRLMKAKPQNTLPIYYSNVKVLLFI